MKARIGFLMNYLNSNINIENYSDLMRGCELIIYDYSKYLINKGYEVFWLLYSDPIVNFNPYLEDIRLIRIERKHNWYNPIESIRFLLSLVNIIRKYNLDVFYTRDTFLGFIAGLSCKITRIPFIFHVEDLVGSLIIASSQRKTRYPLAALMIFFQRAETILATKIITVSKTFKNFLVTNWFIMNKKITVIYEGVEIEKNTRYKDPFPKDNTFSILYIGGTTNYDGIDILITAFAKIEKKIKGIDLIIATFSPEDKCLHLKKLCYSLNIIDKVKFLTSITGEMARVLVKRSDIAVIPRKRNLSTELTTTSIIFLYISEGIPIIAPRLMAILELMRGSALFFQPENVDSLADAMMHLSSDNDFRKKIHYRVLELKDVFSRERMCDILNNLIEKLI